MAAYSVWDQATATQCLPTTNAFCSLLDALADTRPPRAGRGAVAGNGTVARLPPPLTPRLFSERTLPLHRGMPVVLTSMLPSINLTNAAADSWSMLINAVERYNQDHQHQHQHQHQHAAPTVFLA